ncbi:transmembrane protein 134 isoform X4 [Panthera tigris]|uniref:transmembrane protein 134 isoform X5 n=1 Tax=Panthera leo TaxID=9689 RepID=UPI001C69CFD6|nr:transmembrane protein 134 isoform X5 [Panthera leo]XP_042814612.1 transmembrane protein 134 isoform X4 [Panthera tigris]XP_049498365.1 transmembrane protein 134 isoform X6 [Panthera uncia]
MTPSSCPWRTRARGPNSAGSPASGRCTSSAEPGSRWPTRTSSPGCATRDSGRTSIRSSQWSFSTISNSTQRSYHACCSWTQHPLIQKNRRVVLASFLLLLLGLGHTTEQRKISLQTFPRPCQVPCSENTELALILIAVGLEVAPSPGVSSAIFFVPGFLLLVPGVYHVIFIYCAVKGHRGFQFFYLPYFEK